MELETDRLILRKFTPADVEKTYLYSREESRKLGMPNEVYESVEDAAKNVEFIISKYRGNTLPFVLAIDLKETREYIGHISLSEIKRGAEIGYAVCEKHQGKGYATEAVEKFAEWCKARYKLDTIYGLVVPENAPSRKVLEKAGFSFVKDDIDHEYAQGHYLVFQYC